VAKITAFNDNHFLKEHNIIDSTKQMLGNQVD